MNHAYIRHRYLRHHCIRHNFISTVTNVASETDPTAPHVSGSMSHSYLRSSWMRVRARMRACVGARVCARASMRVLFCENSLFANAAVIVVLIEE